MSVTIYHNPACGTSRSVLAIDLMVGNPALIERPIVVSEKGARLCRPKEKVLEIL